MFAEWVSLAKVNRLAVPENICDANAQLAALRGPVNALPAAQEA